MASILDEFRDEFPDILAGLDELDTVLSLETKLVGEGEYDMISKLQEEKLRRMAVLERANAILQTAKRLDGNIDIDSDEDLYDLAVTMININNTAKANENAILGAIRASQFTIHSIARAMVTETNNLHYKRYDRTGKARAMNASSGVRTNVGSS